MTNRKKKFRVIFDLESRFQPWDGFIEENFAENEISEFLDEVVSCSSFGKAKNQFEISIILTNDEEIAAFNQEFRGKNGPTNVLSFPSLEPEDFRAGISCAIMPIGEILISFERIQEEAIQQEKKFKDHFLHMLAHGSLHLLGYDHVVEEEAEKMETLEIEILSKFSINSPY